MMLEELPTPALLIDAATVRRNIRRMAEYAASHGLKLRPHTKTHKSRRLAAMQLDAGAVGLTVAKAGEAQVMGDVSDDLLMAYPAVDGGRCRVLAELAAQRTVRVAIDSATAAEGLSGEARSAGVTIGVLVDLDVGNGRTGVQSAEAALALAQRVDGLPGLRLDGLFYYPGHIGGSPAEQAGLLGPVGAKLERTLDLWRRSGLAAPIVSGGSTPTARQSHLLPMTTEIRPGTYIFNDLYEWRGGHCRLEDCAARVACTVVSDAVSGQVVIDAGSKTLSSDPCGTAPDSGYGYVVEYPEARIAKLSEEHGQVDVSGCEPASGGPRVGQRVTVIPNHICTCVNLQGLAWWREEDGTIEPLSVDARGRVF